MFAFTFYYSQEICQGASFAWNITYVVLLSKGIRFIIYLISKWEKCLICLMPEIGKREFSPAIINGIIMDMAIFFV